MITRRQFLGSSVLPLAAFTGCSLAQSGVGDSLTKRLGRIEQKSGGRLGVSVLDTGSGRRDGYRTDERFPMCSTFKVLASALVLSRVDKGEERLTRRIVLKPGDILPNSPATEKHVGGEGMSLADLCEAAITLSDNAAANAILASFDGPAALTAYARSLGDTLTRLDRMETELNEARAGDPRDTTTPAAMLGDMNKILLGEVLSASSRAQLLRWLDANKTGGERIRAGLPADWLVGDKTGSGDNGTANDIAILRPPGRAPILLCVYLTAAKVGPAERNAAIADVARQVAGWV
jgi:beta-lactamase class A